MIGTILGIGALALKGIGAFKQAQENSELANMIKKQEAELNTRRTMLENQDFLNTRVGKSGVEAIKDMYKTAYQKTGQGNTIMGASAEAKLANQAQLTEGMVDKTQQWAGNATEYQTQQEALLIPQEQQNLQQKMGLQQSRADSWGAVGDTAMNAFALTTMMGKPGGKIDLKGLLKGKGAKGVSLPVTGGTATPSFTDTYFG